MEKNKIILKDQASDQLIVIGDIHGLTVWRTIVVHHSDARYVFLGDYCDPYGTSITNEQVIENFSAIIDFKQRYPDRVVLLLGNHDVHYLRPQLARGSRYNLDLAPLLADMFRTHASLFQPAFGCHHMLFTHAGVLQSWLDRFKPDSALSVAENINARPDNLALYECSFLRGGRHDYSGIFWADIDEFTNEELLPGYIQVVGHNRVPSIQVQGESILSTGHIIFCDSLRHGHYLVIEAPDADVPHFFEASFDINHCSDYDIQPISGIVKRCSAE